MLFSKLSSNKCVAFPPVVRTSQGITGIMGIIGIIGIMSIIGIIGIIDISIIGIVGKANGIKTGTL